MHEVQLYVDESKGKWGFGVCVFKTKLKKFRERRETAIREVEQQIQRCFQFTLQTSFFNLVGEDCHGGEIASFSELIWFRIFAEQPKLAEQ